MFSLPSSSREQSDTRFLQPPVGRRYVRAFLFSRRVNAPLASVHLLARILLILSLSAAELRTINAAQPDLLVAFLFWIPALVLFLCSGMSPHVARLYVLLTVPALIALFVTWCVFAPVPGTVTLLRYTVYSGKVVFGLAMWEVLWVVIVVGYFLWRKSIVSGILLATLAAFLFSLAFPLPSLVFTRAAFFHPLTVYVSDRGLVLALTKVIGYSGMVLVTIALVVTSRDMELIGALRQLRVPQPVIFFLSTVFRALTLALSDYETIYQAQVARAINVRPRTLWRRILDMASIAVPMVAMMIRRSSEIGDALLARGYKLNQHEVDFYETVPWRLLDWAVLLLSVLLFYWAVAPHPHLTAWF